MKIDLRKKVEALKEEFKSEFGVGIRVYKGAKFAENIALKLLVEPGSKGGEITFHGKTLVKNVEKAFAEELGIRVQVENKEGKLADNEATLASLKK
jgi:lipid A disaccharide synthetase